MTWPGYFKNRLEKLEKDKKFIRSNFNILLLGAFYPEHQFERLFEEDDRTIYGSEMIKDELKKIRNEIKVAYVPVEDDDYLLETIESQLENLIKDYPKISNNF